jgi:hypothetical protein
VVIGLSTSAPKAVAKARRERDISSQIASVCDGKGGERFLHLLISAFEIDGDTGTHQCLAYEPVQSMSFHLAESRKGLGYSR